MTPRDAAMSWYAEREEALRREVEELLRSGRPVKAEEKQAAARRLHRARRQERLNEQPTGLLRQAHRQYP